MSRLRRECIGREDMQCVVEIGVLLHSLIGCIFIRMGCILNFYIDTIHLDVLLPFNIEPELNVLLLRFTLMGSFKLCFLGLALNLIFWVVSYFIL